MQQSLLSLPYESQNSARALAMIFIIRQVFHIFLLDPF